jgi:hypothetical protein
MNALLAILAKITLLYSKITRGHVLYMAWQQQKKKLAL